MRILLVNPPYIKERKIFMKEIGRCGSTANGNQHWPQTGLAYLAAMVHGDHEAIIIDSIAEEIGYDETLRRIVEFRPDMIVAHTTTPTYPNDLRFIGRIKDDYGKAVIGLVGNHASNRPRESLQETGADFVLMNEPESTFADMLKVSRTDWSQVSGLAYMEDGKAVVNKPRKLGDLDLLPMPARHLLPNDKYRMKLTEHKPFATVVPSRGCPYECIYCRVGYPWGKRFRKRSTSSVLDELVNIRKDLGIRNIVFMADTFTLDRRWVLDLCEGIRKEGLDIEWLCNSRVDTIDAELAKAMSLAGCRMISFGIESGSQEILDGAKKNLDLKKAREAVRIAKDAGIKVFAYFIIGLPGETPKTVAKTIKFSKELDPDYVNFHIATPHPGTELESMARKHGWIVDDDFEHYDQSGNYAVMRNASMTAAQILKARKKAMRHFYLRPKILVREMSKIRSPKDLVKTAGLGIRLIRSNI